VLQAKTRSAKSEQIMCVKRISKTNIILTVFFLWLSCPVLAQDDPVPQEILETMYTLCSGDRIKITVFGENDLSGVFQVDGSGYISFPLIGEVTARGLNIRELEQNLVSKLQDGYLVDPLISLEVLNYRPFYILGEVKSPGQYEYVSGITLYNAVAMAGGYTYRARRNKAQITRDGSGELIENADHSTVILPGDIINIRERFF
jgi:polysaccharide biosynthesis/export protein VpsN